jgi:hypothetical protein
MRHLQRLLLIGLLMLAPAAALAGDPGDSGAVFLRFGMGGRASGMGEAYIGVAKDATSVYWNPGAMAAVLGTHAMFMHTEYFESIRFDQAAISHETDYGTIGLSFTGLYMDEMDRYDDSPADIPLGTFSAYDVSVSVGFARYILPNLAVGIAGKVIYENIDEFTAKGFAVDAGIYHVSLIDGVKLAAVVANLGPPIKFEDDGFTGEEFELPWVIKLGGSFERHYPGIHGDVLLTFDAVLPNDGDVKQHIGAEYGYDKKLFIRGGFKGGYDSQGATFGAGVRYRRYTVDYAMLLVDNDLGDSHRISVSLDI